MAKQKKVWNCQECGHQSSKWIGQCPSCKEWNTFVEETIIPPSSRNLMMQIEPSKPVPLVNVEIEKYPRLQTNIGEFDRLIGGGIVPGSLILVGGDPGIGKSTLMLQVSDQLAQQDCDVLYVCAEESTTQTSLRAKRLNIKSKNIMLYNENNFSLIQQEIENLKPQIIVADSIQILYNPQIPSAPGSVTQVRETATEFMHIAKRNNIAIFLIGHVTKTGEIAGPRVLEHIVDTVLYFEGDKHLNYRILRAVKNRFGPTDEIAVFQMQLEGLKEIKNPSQIFLEERRQATTGSIITSTMEGSRPLLIELQALVTETAFSNPSRRCTGIDQNRLALLLAVMEKRLRYQLYRNDVFASVAGGIKILEPSTDLALLIAIASSFSNHVVDSSTIVMGEVGLGGEVRAVTHLESRIKEAINLGFEKAIIPKRNEAALSKKTKKTLSITGVENVEQAIEFLIN
jgi:DNA repair protein RadA/Sms